MSNARFVDSQVTHALSRHVDFELYGYTACMMRVAWRSGYFNESRSFAVRVDDPVDCMTCLVRLARELETPCV